MKNTSKIVLTTIVVAIVGIGGYFFLQNNEKPEMVKDELLVKPTSTVKEDSNVIENADINAPSYVQYSKTAFDSSSNNRRVLFFYASWCPTCKPADQSFVQNESQIPDDLTVIRVNYNDPETDQEEKDLARKYGVTYQHTFVQIDGKGMEVTKWNGGQIKELLSNIK